MTTQDKSLTDIIVTLVDGLLFLPVVSQDYDPPSEGQVILRPHTRSHHDPILALLARMDQGPVIQEHAEVTAPTL